MIKTRLFNARTQLSEQDTLLVALFAAALIHLFLLFGISFTDPEPPGANKRSIDVTLVTVPAKKPPKQAKFLAQDNQIGTGKKYHKPEPAAQRIASAGSGQVKQEAERQQEQADPKVKQKVLTQPQSSAKTNIGIDKDNNPSPASHPHITAESLQQQIAQYGAEMRLKQQSSDSDETKIKHVNSVSAHRYAAAQYIKDWERKVETIGNMNYPSIAARKNFSASLTMDVGVKPDGSIYNMRITKSSGYPELDEAAKRIVRMSAPFPALPSDLLKELNVLVITRKWRFSDESGMVIP
jgi:periplasmic protein TonB